LEKNALKWIGPLQHIFYVFFVLLWFKDNFSPLRNLPLSYFFALIPLLILTLVRFILKYRRKKIGFPGKITKETAALLALLLLTVIVRIPCLVYPNGMMTSDDAIPALMGKHISEGKVPPVCFYGQLYMGSLSSHFFALMFKVFGYSMFVLKGATLLIYLAFMAVQFFFLKDIFSYQFALAVAFFYSLPFIQLVTAGLDNTSAYPLVLLLGALLLYLTYLISFKARENWLPVLGFLMGLAFWTHQITIGFILTSLLVLLFKTRFKIKTYARLFFYAVLGFLPQLLIEVFNRFQLAGFLTTGKRIVNWEKVKSGVEFTASLFASDGHALKYIFLFFLFSGFIYLVFLSWKKKAFLPQSIFSLFFLIFYLFYIFSYFSNRPVVRYLYPLYFCLPALLLAPFLALKSRLRNVLSFGLVVFLFLSFSMKGTLTQYEMIKGRHQRIDRVMAAMEKTGKKFWYAEYWTAYLLTAASKEKLIVDSYSVNRYSPYTLSYWNQNDKDNYVFLFVEWADEKVRQASFIRWLETLDIRTKKIDTGEGELFIDIETRLNPRIIMRDPPPNLPQLELEQIDPREGYLRLIFQNKSRREDIGFWLSAEIPGFSSEMKRFSLADEEVKINLPYPQASSFAIKYYLEYFGVKIPSSARKLSYSLPKDKIQERDSQLVYLRGFGPEVNYLGKNRRICEKEIAFEINKAPVDDLEVRVFLCSPFQFSSWNWYGRNSQKVSIEVNQAFFGKRELKDGENVIRLRIPKNTLKRNGNIIALKFRYHLWHPSFPLWRVAAFLNKIEVSQPSPGRL